MTIQTRQHLGLTVYVRATGGHSTREWKWKPNAMDEQSCAQARIWSWSSRVNGTYGRERARSRSSYAELQGIWRNWGRANIHRL